MTKDELIKDGIANNHFKSDDPKEAEKEFTCFLCSEKDKCVYAWDLYNTNGECLAEK